MCAPVQIVPPYMTCIPSPGDPAADRRAKETGLEIGGSAPDERLYMVSFLLTILPQFR